MDMEETITKLKRKREWLDAADRKLSEERERVEKTERPNLYAAIKSLAPRISKLLVLGRALYKYGFLDVAHSRNPNFFGTHERYPHIGFNDPKNYRNFYKDRPDIFYIGISYNDLDYHREASTDVSLWVGENGDILVTDKSEKYVVFGDNHLKTHQLRQFIDEFDAFEKKVYDYATSL